MQKTVVRLLFRRAAIVFSCFFPNTLDCYGRSSDLSRSLNTFPFTSWWTVVWSFSKILILWTFRTGNYSSGYCPGFPPGSLLSGRISYSPDTTAFTNIGFFFQLDRGGEFLFFFSCLFHPSEIFHVRFPWIFLFFSLFWCTNILESHFTYSSTTNG